jgi:hypothetical protein
MYAPSRPASYDDGTDARLIRFLQTMSHMLMLALLRICKSEEQMGCESG